MQIFGHAWAEVHSLFFVHKIEFHFIDSFDFINNPGLWLDLFEHLDEVEDICNYISSLSYSFVS